MMFSGSHEEKVFLEDRGIEGNMVISFLLFSWQKELLNYLIN